MRDIVDVLEQKLFGFMYDVSEEEKNIFKNNWCGPKQLQAWEPTLIAKYPRQEDGQDVELFVTAAPARFYTLKALGVNSYTVETGSADDLDMLMHVLATQIANGTITFSQDTLI